MTKYFLLLNLLLFTVLSNAQKTERYSGDFFNGEKIKGTANYTYYKDSNNEQVKEGSFRYSAREKNDKYRFSHSISGNYKSGYKIGKWTYNYSSKDYKIDKEGYYYTVEVNLNALYNNGYPNGKWTYSSKINKYKKIIKQGRLKKIDIQKVKDLRIQLSWNKQKLCDSLIVINNLGENIYISMNEDGYLDGEFAFIEDIEGVRKEFWNYKDGILVNKGIDTNIVINKEYLSYTNLKSPNTEVKKVASSLLIKESCEINKYLREEIFNHDYTLYRYISGDKVVRKDKKTNKIKLVYKGLYFYKLKPILSSKENELIKGIEVNHEKVRQAEWLVNRQILKNPKVKKYTENKRRIVQALNEFDKIDCNISIYKNYINIDNIKLVSQNKCGVNSNSSTIINKEEYLDALVYSSKHQIKILEAYNQL